MRDIRAFVPRLAAELGGHEDAHWTSVDGSMLSADISGFTALSERLAGKGKAGAEEITELINKCFTALIDSAYTYGGEIIKFGGDALLVLFRGPEHERRTANASLAMQHALHASSAARSAQLTMTVGAAEGPFNVFLVGHGYRELLITGPNASKVIHLEGEAAKGETLVSPAIAAVLPTDMLGREHAGGVAISGATGDSPGGPRARSEDEGDLTPFVPPPVLEQLDAFEELEGEHRLVTVGFLMVAGISAQIETHGPQVTAEALGHLVDSVMAATEPFGVTVLHTDIAPDGVKFVLCAGAPINPGDTADALLQAALEIAAIDTPFTLRQGVQTGRVFAGFLGSAQRRTYTLMGDSVNTAARMIGKAADREIVAVESVVIDTRTIFVTEKLEPFLVKGKTRPVVAHKVLAVSDEVRRRGLGSRLVGRRSELAALTSAIGQLGRVVVLDGPAGSGKSRLLDAAWDDAEGLTAFQGSCTPYGAASPYSVFRTLLRSGTGIDLLAEPTHAGKLLKKVVAEYAPNLLPMLPLLAVPFGAVVESTPEADAVDPDFRRARVQEVLVDFLDATLTGPVLMVVEDLQWIDDASGDLVRHIARAVADRSWALVLTRRPESAWDLSADQDHVAILQLEPLADEHIREITIDAAARSLSDAELEAVTSRSAGNPFFAIELATAMTTTSVGELPDSIEDLISTRIDNLPPKDRHLLRIASVFGREFELSDVNAVSGHASEVGPALADLVEYDDDGDLYRFRNAMYRDAAYAGLPFRQRRRLHRQVAERLEQGISDPVVLAPLLSVHYSEAGQHHQAWEYSRIAGDLATDQYAHIEAAQAYERALAAGRRIRGLGDHERAVVAERLGDALLASGQFEPAFAAYGRARRRADELSATRLMRRQGMVRDRQGSTAVATRWYRRSLARLPEVGGSESERKERIDVALAFAAARHRQGKFRDCLWWAERAASEARDLGDRASLAKATDRLHVAATYLGLDDAERYGPEALALHRDLGDHLSQARILDNMGIQAYFNYDWDRALELYAEAAAAGRLAGDVIEANLGRMNAAEVRSDRGEFDLAEKEFADVLRNWTAAGWSFGMAGCRSNLALVRSRRGDRDGATTYEQLGSSLEEFRSMGADEFIAEGMVRLCEAAAHRGDVPAVLRHADEARSTITDDALVARIERHVGLAHLMAGEPGAAEAALRSSLDRARSARARYEIALAAVALDSLGAGASRPHDADLDLVAQLGIVMLPAAFGLIGAELPAT